MKKTNLRLAVLTALAAIATPFVQPSLRAADHGDAPNVAHDQAGDIADVFFFMDPGSTTNAVIIATFHGFIVPGEASNFGIFDPDMRYRFHIENTGDTKDDATIDVTFNDRTATFTGTESGVTSVAQPQTATIAISGVKTKLTAPATNPSLGATAPDQTVTTLAVPAGKNTPAGSVDFFAGEVDDPFFFDIPAFSRFIGKVRAGDATAANEFSRARDSFAGYNTLAIAIRVPLAILKGKGTADKLGVYFSTERHIVQKNNAKDGSVKSSGAFRVVDRMATPAVNVALIPFNLKNAYNLGTPKDDAKLKFAGPIVATLNALGTTGTPTDPMTNQGILASVAVLNGDYLRLDPTVANMGDGGGNNAGAGFPNGRRLGDDTIDTLLFFIANQAPLKDNVNSNDVTLQNVFPYLAKSQQPLGTGVTDDNTRN